MGFIAYKVSKGNPELPDGFITDHFEVTTPILEGYTVVSLEAFNSIFQGNATLLQAFERSRGIITVDSTQVPVETPKVAQAVPPPPANNGGSS